MYKAHLENFFKHPKVLFSLTKNKWITLLIYILGKELCLIPLLFSLSVVSNSLGPYGMQRARFSCPLVCPRVYWNSCLFSWWCHPTSHPLFPLLLLQSFPASGSFPMRQLFASGGLSIEAPTSTSILPKNIQGWFPLELTGLISLQSEELSRVFSNTTVQNINSSVLSFLHSPTLTSIHDYWKNHSFD